jgi:copper chaperone CopZ
MRRPDGGPGVSWQLQETTRQGMEREVDMADVTLVVRDLGGSEDAERLERAISRLDFVRATSVDSDSGLVAVSYDGGAAELKRIERVISEAGHDLEHSPGADQVSE